MKYYAHSLEGLPPEQWQPLDEHLKAVAELAAEFAKPFGGEEWAYLAGLWHDLGKYSDAFQKYLRQNVEACAETLPGKVDHSTAGSQYAKQQHPVLGLLVAYVIAGHHGGLPDAHAEGSSLDKRMVKTVEYWQHGLAAVDSPVFPKTLPLPRDSFATGFFVRMLFSCLVDADFLDTERFMLRERQTGRRSFPCIAKLCNRFFQSEEIHDNTLEINAIRAEVRVESERKASLMPGFFTLTVPTGGGKTLTSMAFALKHAKLHGLRRIIYVAPFTSIIEQNADVFRSRLGADVVIEHHSNVDPEAESNSARLAAENWDAPLIVTTSVQFYESLFSNRPSRCRKLHNIARSVIIMDEAQTLPVEYLQPCLMALKELVSRYGCSVILCTATPPAISYRQEFNIGIKGIREIIENPKSLYERLRRVRVFDRGILTDRQLAEEICARKQSLCIVNTVGHARKLFEHIGEGKGHYHLSARMCPAHRRAKLCEIRERLNREQSCHLISTQVVEAGVDIDFPVVYRSLAGLDSIAQAAGRCNRNNKIQEGGSVFIFRSEHPRADSYFRDTAQCAAQVMALHPDPLSLDANEHYFRLYYWNRQSDWDKKHILEQFCFTPNHEIPFDLSFAKVTADFHIIDDASTCSIVVPWGEEGRRLADSLRKCENPTRELLRSLQRYMVQIRKKEWDRHAGCDIKLVFDNLGILESPEAHYSEDTGLNLEADGPGSFFG